MIKVIFLSDNEKGTVMMDEAEELVANLFLGNAWWQVGALFLSILLFLLAGKLARVILSRVAGRMDREKRVLTAVAFRSVSRVVLFAMVVVMLFKPGGIFGTNELSDIFRLPWLKRGRDAEASDA